MISFRCFVCDGFKANPFASVKVPSCALSYGIGDRYASYRNLPAEAKVIRLSICAKCRHHYDTYLRIIQSLSLSAESGESKAGTSDYTHGTAESAAFQAVSLFHRGDISVDRGDRYLRVDHNNPGWLCIRRHDGTFRTYYWEP